MWLEKKLQHSFGLHGLMWLIESNSIKFHLVTYSKLHIVNNLFLTNLFKTLKHQEYVLHIFCI